MELRLNFTFTLISSATCALITAEAKWGSQFSFFRVQNMLIYYFRTLSWNNLVALFKILIGYCQQTHRLYKRKTKLYHRLDMNFQLARSVFWIFAIFPDNFINNEFVWCLTFLLFGRYFLMHFNKYQQTFLRRV